MARLFALAVAVSLVASGLAVDGAQQPTQQEYRFFTRTFAGKGWREFEGLEAEGFRCIGTLWDLTIVLARRAGAPSPTSGGTDCRVLLGKKLVVQAGLEGFKPFGVWYLGFVAVRRDPQSTAQYDVRFVKATGRRVDADFAQAGTDGFEFAGYDGADAFFSRLRGEPGASVDYRIVRGAGKPFVDDINAAAADGFTVAGPLPEEKGRATMVLWKRGSEPAPALQEYALVATEGALETLGEAGWQYVDQVAVTPKVGGWRQLFADGFKQTVIVLGRDAAAVSRPRYEYRLVKEQDELQKELVPALAEGFEIAGFARHPFQVGSRSAWVTVLVRARP